MNARKPVCVMSMTARPTGMTQSTTNMIKRHPLMMDVCYFLSVGALKWKNCVGWEPQGLASSIFPALPQRQIWDRTIPLKIETANTLKITTFFSESLACLPPVRPVPRFLIFAGGPIFRPNLPSSPKKNFSFCGAMVGMAGHGWGSHVWARTKGKSEMFHCNPAPLLRQCSSLRGNPHQGSLYKRQGSGGAHLGSFGSGFFF